jgi:hypothetical protein
MSDINITVNDEIVNIDIVDEPVLVNVVNSPGVPGAPGQGVPVGGTTGQVLAKNSATNYDTAWVNVSGGAWGTITGTLSNQTDLQNALNAKVPYTGATTNVNLGEYEIKAGQLTLDTSPTGTAAVGTTRWNDTTGSSETTLKGGNVILKNGVDLVARVVNKVSPNTTLTKAAYQAVRVSGAQGQRLAVAFAQANNDNNSADTIGLITETIATNQEGFIITVGQLEGINTTGSLQGETWADGDVLYLSPTTAGALTNVKPNATIGHIVVVGYVEYAHAINGKIYVKVMNGWELGELHDVYVPTPSNNDVLTYETSSGLWKSKSVGTALGYTPANAATTITINGVTFDLSANRTFTVGSVTGSGASGQVAYWTGTSSQSGDSGLTWDSTNKRLTISTSGQGRTISTFHPTGAVGGNIWIGNGGNLTQYTSGFTGSYNTSIGVDALLSNTTGRQNSAVGVNALYSNTTGYYNSAIGLNALRSNNIGHSNCAIGSDALYSNTTGYYNSANGVNALYTNTTGYGNSAIGLSALFSNTTGYYNSAIGVNSLFSNNSGYHNTSLGYQAGHGTGTNANTTGNNNIFIGALCVGISSTESNRTWIGNSSTTSTWLAGNLLLGSTTDSGERLQVTGTMKVTGNITAGGQYDNTVGLSYTRISATVNPGYARRILIDQPNSRIQLTQGNSDGNYFLTRENNVSTTTYDSTFGAGSSGGHNGRHLFQCNSVNTFSISGNNGLTIFDGINIVTGTTTGTKIGTSTSEKLSFWNAAPIVQPTTAIAEATFVENFGGSIVNVDSTFAGYTLQQIAQALKNTGLLS